MQTSLIDIGRIDINNVTIGSGPVSQLLIVLNSLLNKRASLCTLFQIVMGSNRQTEHIVGDHSWTLSARSANEGHDPGATVGIQCLQETNGN